MKTGKLNDRAHASRGTSRVGRKTVKSVVLLLYSFVLVGCAGGGNRVDPIENLRNSSMTVVEGYSRSVATALAFGDQEGQVIEKAKLAVSASLKDPGSAQFQNVRMANYGSWKVVCGEVNGKNSYGGYVGFGPFVAGVNGATLFDKDNKYPAIQAAANAGIRSACQ